MIPYIIKVALILAGCLAFYKVLLRRETFYRVNRFTLMFCLFIAFSLPLLQVPQQWSFRKPAKESVSTVQKPVVSTTASPIQKQSVIEMTPVTPFNDNTDAAETSPSFSIKQFMGWLFWIYWFGVVVFGISFLFQVILLLWRSRRNQVIIDGQYRIVEVTGDKAPCSFGNTIFINPAKYDWETYNQILLHEKVHIRERHTLDILLAELVLIFQWFNPFAWIYRREIENNLEYLTDDQLIKQKVDKASYQLSLVKVTAPNFPLRLTTNYNQSILKKRIAMMNSKRSNLHTAWKYFFLLPLLALLACVLNEPKAQKNKSIDKTVEKNVSNPIETEGYWFARIKEGKVNIMFSEEKVEDDDPDFKKHGGYNSTTFNLSDLSPQPGEGTTTFSITRDAGRMDFTGKFEGKTGMGRYKFTADKSFEAYIKTELKESKDDDKEEDEALVFFFVNVTRSYISMLKKEGFTNITKDDIIPLAALNIDAAFIKSIKDAGFKNVTSEELIPLKALGIDAAYIKEIRDAGYKNIDLDQLVSFKAQGIDKEYITKVKTIKGKDGKDLDDDDADDIVSFKALNIDEEFVNSFKAVGLTNIPRDQLVSMKALGVTAEYIKSWQAMGFKDIDPDQYVGLKAQNVTPEDLKKFQDMGYKNVEIDDLVSLKALGVTPEFMKSFEAIGYKDIELDEFNSLKALGITPEFIKSFEAVGFKNISIDDIVSVKATGVTPEYIKAMKDKGFSYDKLEKYVRLKSID